MVKIAFIDRIYTIAAMCGIYIIKTPVQHLIIKKSLLLAGTVDIAFRERMI